MVFDAKCKSKARLNGKTAIVTGSNTGIGKCTVRDFYRRGARVIMACRNVEKAQGAATDIVNDCKGEENLGKLVVLHLDLSSLKSVKECAERLLENEEHIELLINNAGVFCCPYEKTEDGHEMHLQTNHLGHFLLTLLLLPRMIASKPARIVNVTSMVHSGLNGPMRFDDLNWETRPYAPFQLYCQSKLANILFTKALATKLQDARIEGVTTYAVHPGAVATDVSRHMDDCCGFTGAEWLFNRLVKPFFKTAEFGAQTIIYCAVDENIVNETGLYYVECKVKEPSSKAKKSEDATLLWNLSLKMVRLDENYNPFSA